MSINNIEPAPEQPKQPKQPTAKGKVAPEALAQPRNATTRYRLTFLSSGSVTNVKKLLNFGNDPNKSIEKFIPLFNGGFLVMYAPDRFRRRSGFFLTQEGEYDDAWKGFNNDIFHYSYLEHNETMWGMIIQNAPYSWIIITDTLYDKNVVYSKFTIHFIIYVLFF